MKVDIDLVKECALNQDIDGEKVAQLIFDLKQRKKAEPEREPAEKKQYVILVADANGELKNISDHGAWVVAMNESDDPRTLVERISNAAADYNRSPRCRSRVATVGMAMERVSAKYFKEYKVWVKTKSPTAIVDTDNRLSNA